MRHWALGNSNEFSIDYTLQKGPIPNEMAKTKKLYQKIIKRTLSWLMIFCRQLLIVDTKNSSAASDTAVFNYSGSQTRTDDNLINSQVLYQLSYAGMT